MEVLQLCLVLIIAASTACGDQRIIGGYPAPEGSAPYHVSLQNLNGDPVCGGAIISTRAIVTAAHCFVNALPEQVKIVAGTNDLTKTSKKYNVAKITPHENHDGVKKENDIALLFTNEPIEFSDKIRPIKILSQFVKGGENLTFTGFGFTEKEGKPSTILQMIKLSVLDFETCKYAYRNIRQLYDSQICTFNRINEGVCYGDSGGPLTDGVSLIGLTSFGLPCATGYPDVFTRVSSYVEWIRKYVPDVEISDQLQRII